MIVTFNNTKILKTRDGMAVNEIEVAGEDKIYKPANTIIKNNTLEVWNDEIASPFFIRYGWKSYSEGNLVNEKDLPASTFSNEYEQLGTYRF